MICPFCNIELKYHINNLDEHNHKCSNCGYKCRYDYGYVQSDCFFINLPNNIYCIDNDYMKTKCRVSFTKTNYQRISQSNHGFAPGEFAYLDNNGIYQKHMPTNTNVHIIPGYVMWVDKNTFDVVFSTDQTEINFDCIIEPTKNAKEKLLTYLMLS